MASEKHIRNRKQSGDSTVIVELYVEDEESKKEIIAFFWEDLKSVTIIKNGKKVLQFIERTWRRKWKNRKRG